MARRARVVIFDKRGTGLSDRLGQLPNLDQRMDDARAVMDAAGIERATIMGVSEGGSLAVLFAASHPERCSALILYGAFEIFGLVPDQAKVRWLPELRRHRLGHRH